jgi:hypothetical protein
VVYFLLFSQTKFSSTFIIAPVRAAFLANLILLDFITLTTGIFGDAGAEKKARAKL